MHGQGEGVVATGDGDAAGLLLLLLLATTKGVWQQHGPLPSPLNPDLPLGQRHAPRRPHPILIPLITPEWL
jgi:hypothetical protein